MPRRRDQSWPEEAFGRTWRIRREPLGRTRRLGIVIVAEAFDARATHEAFAIRDHGFWAGTMAYLVSNPSPHPKEAWK